MGLLGLWGDPSCPARTHPKLKTTRRVTAEQGLERWGARGCCVGNTELKSCGIAAAIFRAVWGEAAAPVLTHCLLWGERTLRAGDGAGCCVLLLGTGCWAAALRI